MSNKFFLSFFMLSAFLAVDTAVVAKEKKAEFKYKLKSGDVSREFMSDIVGNTKSYFYDFAKNFKKHPEAFVAFLSAAVPYALYKKEVDGYVADFIFGVEKNGKQISPDHKKELAAAWVATMVAAYVCKNKINATFFDEDEVISEEAEALKDSE